jgi:hypothetical protein
MPTFHTICMMHGAPGAVTIDADTVRTEELDMSTQVPPGPVTNRAQHEAPRESAWVGGLTMFAVVMMLIVGVLQALNGIAALFNDKVYVTTPRGCPEFRGTSVAARWSSGGVDGFIIAGGTDGFGDLVQRVAQGS